MILFRALAVVLALSFLLNMAAFTVTGQPRWRQWAMLSLRWGVVLGLCFFGLLVLRRAAVFLWPRFGDGSPRDSPPPLDQGGGLASAS